jgi:hypothetical protein
MKDVFQYIAQKSAEFSRHPLFSYLRDSSVDPLERLRFVPSSVHFVMTFADLYHFGLHEPKPRDRFEELANVHLSEEAMHWKWFLADLTNLDLDPTMRFTDAVRYIWSDHSAKTRGLAYEICKLSAGLRSMQKLVMVQSIEATGRVALEAAVPAGREAAARLGRNLVYFGALHLDTERGHTLEEASVHHSLEEIAIDEATRNELHAIVDRVFLLFEGFVDEGLRYAKEQRTIGETVQQARFAAQA